MPAPARLNRRRFMQTAAASSLLARRATAAPMGPIEKPHLTLGIPLDAASFMPVYVATARTFKAQGLDV